MPGPPPKDPKVRARRNKPTTRAVAPLPAQAPEVTPPPFRPPALPVRPCSCGGAKSEEPKPKKRGRGRPKAPRPPCAHCHGTGVLPWHHLTLAWWSDVWDPTSNPFVGEYLKTDHHGLVRLALLEDYYYHTYDVEALKEIRLQEQRWGLDVLARRRIGWEIARKPKGQIPVPTPASAVAAAQPQRHDPRKLVLLEGGNRA